VVWSEIACPISVARPAFYEKLLDGKLKAESFGPYDSRCSRTPRRHSGGCLMKGEGYEPSGKGTVTYSRAEPGIDAASRRATAGARGVKMPKMALARRPRATSPTCRTAKANRIGLHAMS